MARKSSPKSLIVCPVNTSKREGAITVAQNAEGSAFTIVIRAQVGAPKEFTRRDGQKYIRSGILKIEGTVDIGGVPHYIGLNSGWLNGKRVGEPEIFFKPATESLKHEKTEAELVPWT